MGRCRRLSLHGAPVLFANSFPKSGTHLLTQVLEGFTRIGPAVVSGLPAVVTYEGDTGRARQLEEILSDLRRFLPGDVAYGHLHAQPEIVSFLCQQGMAAFFILRDPRDVVVSHVHYITKMAPHHIHHRYYAQELKTFDERLTASILGIPSEKIPFPNIRQRFEPYLGWLNQPEVLTLQYEEFILRQEITLVKVLNHALERGFPLSLEYPMALKALAESIAPQRSPTFRSGKIGGWRQAFKEEHIRLFKETTGDLLLQMGYEIDEKWE